MYFNTKNYLKSTPNHTAKHALISILFGLKKKKIKVSPVPWGRLRNLLTQTPGKWKQNLYGAVSNQQADNPKYYI
jgi:hypothetical protein